VQIRYHPNFKGDDTLLFAGSSDDIDLSRSFFLAWDGEDLDLIEYLQARCRTYACSVRALCLRRATKGDAFEWVRNSGTWLVSQVHQKQIVGLLDRLLEEKAAAHQYLEPDGAAVQIMVSKDENYPLPTSGYA
jgi:hypothetical protein